jgi:ribosomal protein S17E
MENTKNIKIAIAGYTTSTKDSAMLKKATEIGMKSNANQASSNAIPITKK